MEEFEYKLKNAKGHNHLYGLFDEIVTDCEHGESKEEKAQSALYSMVRSLIFEASLFYNGYPFYPLYVLRCYECAKQLSGYLINRYEKNSVDKELENLLVRYKKSPIVEYMPRQMYEQCVETSDSAEKLAIIEHLFVSSDSGRRPRDMEIERLFHDNFIKGYKLCQNYLKSTNDFVRYREWFRILNPIHVGNLLAEIPEDSNYDELGDMVDEVLTLQIKMLEDWKNHSYDTFCEFGGVELLDKLY